MQLAIRGEEEGRSNATTTAATAATKLTRQGRRRRLPPFYDLKTGSKKCKVGSGELL